MHSRCSICAALSQSEEQPLLDDQVSLKREIQLGVSLRMNQAQELAVAERIAVSRLLRLDL